MRKPGPILLCLALAIVFALAFASPAKAGIVVHDLFTIKGTAIMLVAQTKGLFLPKGGVLVEFFVDLKPVGKRLSGGDGFAYLEFVPQGTGLLKVEARAGQEKGQGLLLVSKKTQSVVIIDVEGGLAADPFMSRVRPGSREALLSLLKKYHVIYASTGLLGKANTRKWLSKNNFPEALFIKWTPALPEQMVEAGIRVKAIIGGASMITEYIDHIKADEKSGDDKKQPGLFCFEEEVEGATLLEKWEELPGL